MADPAADLQASGFRAACATGDGWAAIATACVEQLQPLPSGANLGFVYGTGPLEGDLSSIVTLLRERTGVRHWVGTVGGGVVTSGTEHHETPALSVLVGAFPDDGFRVFEPITEGLADFRQTNGAWIEQEAPLFGVVHGDPRNQNVGEILASLAEETATFLVGGLSAGTEAFPQVAGKVLDGGLSGVLFRGDLPVVTGLSQGCSPIGKVHTITEAERNVIMAIDGRPALDVFKEDIGEILARDLRRVAGYIFVGFPVAGNDTGDYLVRNVMGIDPQRGWIAVSQLVEPDQPVMFCRRDHATAVEDLKRMLADVTRRASTPPKAALYVSCLARGPHLFGDDSEELKLLRDALGDLPLTGFYANGEICHNRLYGYTGVLALFL